MFPSLGLFKNVICPETIHCSFPYCVFGHKVEAAREDSISKRSPNFALTDHCDTGSSPTSNKKRKLNICPSFKTSEEQSTRDGNNGTGIPVRPETATRPISPPPKRSSQFGSHVTSQVIHSDGPRRPSSSSMERPTLSLNPRLLPKPPASHAVRLQLTRLIHDQLCRLNGLLQSSEDPSKGTLGMSKEELVLEALTEEEIVAKNNPSVYENIVKLRIMKLKKMPLQDWKHERLNKISSNGQDVRGTTRSQESKEILTGLTVAQEVEMLSKLVAKQDGLQLHGYVTGKPSPEAVEQARRGLDAAQDWEQCDRCKTRFQVFPGRRPGDGALTSGGPCTYHPAKPRRPPVNGQAASGQKEALHACCRETVGTSTGCTTAEAHVFKFTDPKRLELVMPFLQTPTNTAKTNQTPVCFDCEMGYTTLGMELIRLTATSWPNGEAILDVLVRPQGEVLDLNSRFSGVRPEDFAKGTTWEESSTPSRDDGSAARKALPVVDSPDAARTLLFSHLSPSTPLIGHALDNDLNAVRIIHPSIIDTVLLYPHPRGLPIRFALKVLTKKHLDRDIQTGDGSAGHDSKEDARAAGDLVRWKVKEAWEKMQRDGWKLDGATFMPPQSPAEVMKAEIASLRTKGDAAFSNSTV